MPLTEQELARRVGASVILREQPLRVRWELGGLHASDGHDLTCSLTCSVSAVAADLDRQLLAEVLLQDRPSVTASDVSRHFHSALLTAAAPVAERFTAAQWMREDNPRTAMLEALRAAGNRTAFECGVELLPPFAIDLRSAGYEQVRLHTLQQEMADKKAAAEVAQLQRAAGVLQQFEAFRASAPQLSAAAVLKQIDSTDQGSLLRTLLLASAGKAAHRLVWIISGNTLVKVSPAQSPIRPELIPLPETLGPMRSVRVATLNDQRRLLLGARDGVMVLDPDAASPPVSYSLAVNSSPLGFNGAVVSPDDGTIFAAHSELGVVRWRGNQPGQPRILLSLEQLGVNSDEGRGAPSMRFTTSEGASIMASIGSGSASASPGPHHLLLLDHSTLLFSAGNALFVCDGSTDEPTPRALTLPSKADVVAILKDQGTTRVIQADGTICSLDRTTLQLDRVAQRGAAIRGAAMLPWLGGSRLLLATQDGPIQSIGLEDNLVSEYASRYRGLRRVDATAAAVVAVSPDRQRLLLWNTWDGHQPATELFIGSLTRHRIADVACEQGFVT